MQRLKGTLSLIFDTIEATANLVEKTQHNVTRQVLDVARAIAPAEPAVEWAAALQRELPSQLYNTFRAVNEGIRAVVETGAELLPKQPISSTTPATPIRSDAAGSLPWLADNAQAVVNGFFGDHLDRRGNGLHSEMQFCHEGRPLPLTKAALQDAYPNATEKICVFVHGLSATEWSWSLYAEQFYGDPTAHFGSMLYKDLGYTPLYVRYNSGRHISQNGRDLAHLISALHEVYPTDTKEIVLLGHSMGGLVVRSATHYGQQHDATWLPLLRHVLCLGAPNLGAPLEKAVHLATSVLQHIQTPGTQVCAELLNARSNGVKDLRFGYTVDEEWQDKAHSFGLEDHRQDIPMLEDVGYVFFSATLTKDPNHPLGQLIGDLLVRPPSAAGMAPEPTRRIPFHSGHVLAGMNHLHLANHPDVYAAILQTLRPKELPPHN